MKKKPMYGCKRGGHPGGTQALFSDTRIRNCDFFVPTYTVSSALWATTSCLLEAGSRRLSRTSAASTALPQLPFLQRPLLLAEPHTYSETLTHAAGAYARPERTSRPLTHNVNISDMQLDA